MLRPVTIVVAACILCFVRSAEAKVFTTCELVIELKKQGFPTNQIDQWLCLIEAESSKSTNEIGGPDSDGSFDYGLYQINDRYWCNSGELPGKGCNISCSDLLTDDISRASRCAMLIYRRQGFDAWVGWNDECKGRILPQLNC